MAALPIGIDLCHKPLRVGCKVSGLVLLQEGSKGAQFNAGGQKTSHGGGAFQDEHFKVQSMEYSDETFDMFSSKLPPARANINASPEMVDCFEEARCVARSSFGSPNIKCAVVVVPNHTDSDEWKSVEAAGKKAFIHVALKLIPEHIAVATAYADKTKLIGTSKLTIVSSTAGACDVYVVSISSKAGMGYEYEVGRQGIHGGEAARHGINEGFFGAVANTMQNVHNVVMEATPITGTIEHMVAASMEDKNDSGFDNVVFVGKSSELEKIREIVNKGFSRVKEWKEFEDSENLAAYGAAVLAQLGEIFK